MSEPSFSLLDGGVAATAEPSADAGGTDFLSNFGAIDIAGSGGGSNSGDVGGSSGGDSFDPAIHVGRDKLNADGSYRKRRGRKSGSGIAAPRSQNARGAAGVKALQNSLEGLHAIIAAATGFEDLKLSEDESEPLAASISEVSKYYNIPVVDPKYMAIAGLVFTAGKVYGPKALLIKMEIAERKAKKNTAEVVPFVPSLVPQTAQDGTQTGLDFGPSESAELQPEFTQF